MVSTGDIHEALSFVEYWESGRHGEYKIPTQDAVRLAIRLMFLSREEAEVVSHSRGMSPNEIDFVNRKF